MPATEEEDRFAALTWRPEAGSDWSDMDGLAVMVRAERTWRVALRVWTRNADGSEQTWERTVPAGPTTQAVPALWSSFRRVEGTEVADHPGGLGAARHDILGVALVLTPQRMRPGVEATFQVQLVGPFGG